MLIDAGADINKVCTQNGASPLLAAVHHSRVSIGRLLISHGADSELPDKSGLRPLHIAARLKFRGMFSDDKKGMGYAYAEDEDTSRASDDREDGDSGKSSGGTGRKTGTGTGTGTGRRRSTWAEEDSDENISSEIISALVLAGRADLLSRGG